jgi:hypothetical protein
MKVLAAITESFVKRQAAQLAASTNAGDVTVTLDDATGFHSNDYVCIGTEGSDTAELAQISAVDGNSISVGALRESHISGDPIVVYRYDNRKFYGSMTAGGSYTELTAYGSPVAIGVNNPQGTFLEYTGTEGYLYFKATYFNSTTTEETALADSDEVLGDETARYCSLYAIRKQAGIVTNAYYSDGDVEAKRKQAENEVNSYLYERYVIPLTNSSSTLEIPNLVTRCTILLAAGYIDYEEYMSDSEGVKWLGEARGILKALQQGNQRLIDSTGLEFTRTTQLQRLRGYPDATHHHDRRISPFPGSDPDNRDMFF